MVLIKSAWFKPSWDPGFFTGTFSPNTRWHGSGRGWSVGIHNLRVVRIPEQSMVVTRRASDPYSLQSSNKVSLLTGEHDPAQGLIMWEYKRKQTRPHGLIHVRLNFLHWCVWGRYVSRWFIPYYIFAHRKQMWPDRVAPSNNEWGAVLCRPLSDAVIRDKRQRRW